MSITTAINKIIHIRKEVYNRKENLINPTPSIDKILEWLDDIQRELDDQNMNKQEAMSFAISAGKPIRHNPFSKGEFVQYKGKELVDEEGTILPQQEFWAIRSGGSWESGWEEYKNN